MKKLLIILLILVASSSFAQSLRLNELEIIQFSGNDFYSDTELEDVIALKESPNALSQFLNNIFGTNDAVYFDTLSLNEEMLRLKSFYFNNGFFNASINSHHIIDTLNRSVELTFLINEGNSCTYYNFDVYGLDSLKGETKNNIQNILEIDTTEIYSYENVSSINNNIIDHLKDNGYMFANVDSTLIYIDTTKNIVNTEIYFYTGKKYTISDIFIQRTGEGKEEVDSTLIYEIVGIKSDEIYSAYNIALGQSRLYKTKLFNVAAINSEVQDTIDNKVPLTISTEIGKMYQAVPEVIMNNEDDRFNLGLGIGFSKKNFLGDARTLTLNGSIAAQNIFEFVQNMSVNNTEVIGYADLRLILDQPFLFGKSIDTRYEIYSTIQKRLNEYNTIARGLKVSLNFEVPPHVYFTSLGTSWNLENLQVLYQDDYLKGIFEGLETGWDSTQVDSVVSNISNSTESINTLLSFNFGVNKTNDYTFPTSGYKTNLIIANANFTQFLMSKIFNYNLKSPLYYKIQIDFSVFPSIYFSKENAFGIKFRAGNIFVYEGAETAVPYNQRFTSGGSNSIRGWQSRELVPDFDFGELDINSISPSDLESIFLDQAAPGGLFQLEGSIETRNRLIGNIGTALFIDYGNTWSNFKLFRYDEIAVSAGFGFRYYTDFIPFRIDFGVKIYDPNSEVGIKHRSFWDDLLQIHFAIGEAF